MMPSAGTLYRKGKIGSMPNDWQALPISRLAHAGYCMRRAALLTNECIWVENADTAKGRVEHERAHTRRMERREDRILLFDQDIFSDSLGLIGKCDCIEAQKDEQGSFVPFAPFKVKMYPVEYKHGKVRREEEYELQLCAQAMCLEEMFGMKISEGAIYYITSHQRFPVRMDESLRMKVLSTIDALNAMRENFTIPSAQFSSKCKRCSLRDACMPQCKHTAENYLRRLKDEAKEMMDV